MLITKSKQQKEKELARSKAAFERLNNVHKNIIKYIYGKYGEDVFDLSSKRRVKVPRQIAMFVLYELFYSDYNKGFQDSNVRLKITEIAGIWSKNHSTTIYAIRSMRDEMAMYRDVKTNVEDILQQCTLMAYDYMNIPYCKKRLYTFDEVKKVFESFGIDEEKLTLKLSEI